MGWFDNPLGQLGIQPPAWVPSIPNPVALITNPLPELQKIAQPAIDLMVNTTAAGTAATAFLLGGHYGSALAGNLIENAIASSPVKVNQVIDYDPTNWDFYNEGVAPTLNAGQAIVGGAIVGVLAGPELGAGAGLVVGLSTGYLDDLVGIPDPKGEYGQKANALAPILGAAFGALAGGLFGPDDGKPGDTPKTNPGSNDSALNSPSSSYAQMPNGPVAQDNNLLPMAIGIGAAKLLLL